VFENDRGESMKVLVMDNEDMMSKVNKKQKLLELNSS
jgi:hypothetical protein